MKKGKEKNLSRAYVDALMELGNIGSGNAVTALSDLLNKKIEMSLTSVEIVPFWKLAEKLGNGKMKVFGINSIVKGESNLSFLQIFSKESIISLINLLSENRISDVKVLKNLDEYSLSIILEIGNILAGHFSSALADLFSTKFIPEVPDVALDTLSAILDGLIAKYSENTDLLILIITKMTIEDLNIEGIFCFIPAIETINRLFEAIGIKLKS